MRKKPIGLAVLVLIQGVTFGLVRLLLEVPPFSVRQRQRWQWSLRRRFWNNFARLKFRGSGAIDIPVPNGRPQKIERVPFKEVFPTIDITNITVAGRIPRDERSHLTDFATRLFTSFQLAMYRWLSPMQPGLPEIDADPYVALSEAYTERHARLFDPPVMPLELRGSPDLAALAVKGPYAGYLTAYRWGQEPEADAQWNIEPAEALPLYEWDFRELQEKDLGDPSAGTYEYHPGLYSLGVRVLFQGDAVARAIRPIRIKSELGLSKPGDLTWETAKKLALCAATTHLSLVRHFNGIHLASAAHLAIATRNRLFPDHPLCRWLWPFIFHTELSNRVVTIAQMAEGGDFESIFSFTHQGMRALFSATYVRYRLVVNHPVKDAARRGLNKTDFDTPMQADLERIFQLYLQSVQRYVGKYYMTDTDLKNDTAVLSWINDLNESIPNGIREVLCLPATAAPITAQDLTIENLSELIASFMYLVTVHHDLVGSFLWNYQLWAHRQPVRLYRNGHRLPLDVYQRLVNANYNLNVPRTPLILDRRTPPYRSDYSYLALQDGRGGGGIFETLQQDLVELDAEWKRDPWQVWRDYPSLLEANINA